MKIKFTNHGCVVVFLSISELVKMLLLFSLPSSTMEFDIAFMIEKLYNLLLSAMKIGLCVRWRKKGLNNIVVVAKSFYEWSNGNLIWNNKIHVSVIIVNVRTKIRFVSGIFYEWMQKLYRELNEWMNELLLLFGVFLGVNEYDLHIFYSKVSQWNNFLAQFIHWNSINFIVIESIVSQWGKKSLYQLILKFQWNSINSIDIESIVPQWAKKKSLSQLNFLCKTKQNWQYVR